jgi:hypothetical protein
MELRMSKVQLSKQKLIRKQSYWSEIVAEWDKNPISMAIFCRNKNINQEQFYYWRRKLSTIENYEPNKDDAFIEIANLHSSITSNKPSLIEHSTSLLEILLPNKVNIMVTIPTIDIGKLIQQLSGGMLC